MGDNSQDALFACICTQQFTLRRAVDYLRAVSAVFDRSSRSFPTTPLKEMMQKWNENSTEHPDLITRVRAQLNDVTSDLRVNVEKLHTRAEALGSLGSRADYVV